MTNVETLYRIWVYLQTEPLFWLTITIGAFLVGDYLYKKSNINPLVNPVAISILIVSGILLTFGIEYERYFNGAQFIHFLLGPATVALAIPIYNQIKLIQKEALSNKVYDYAHEQFGLQQTVDLWHEKMLEKIENWKSKYKRWEMIEL